MLCAASAIPTATTKTKHVTAVRRGRNCFMARQHNLQAASAAVSSYQFPVQRRPRLGAPSSDPRGKTRDPDEKVSRPSAAQKRGQPTYDPDMPRLDYLHLDVFTSRRFEGNQLAVFRDGRALDAVAMQRIARETNFSESTFILPPERPDTDVRMRIFTPGVELPMAGHPTIGSTFALAHLGVIRPGLKQFVFGLGVGPTRVELTWDGDRLSFAWMDQRLPEVREPAVSVDLIVRAAGIEPNTHATTGLPIQEISCGVPFILLPVASRAAVDSAVPDSAALRGLKSSFGRDHIGIYLFSTERASD